MWSMPRRLRWQLTLSHVVAIAFTLVALVTATVLIALVWIVGQVNPYREVAQDARIVATAVRGMVTGGVDPTELDAVLRLFTEGRLRVQPGPPPFAPELPPRLRDLGPALRDLRYIAIVRADGDLIASSDAAGAEFSPLERDAWSDPVRFALAGERDLDKLIAAGPEGGPAAIGAYPIFDANDRVVAAVVVGKNEVPRRNRVANLLVALAAFGAATITVLAAASLFALASSSLLAYLLARRVVARLERLGRAAEALAGGDLRSRVEEGPADEVGQLTRRFNRMADRLAETVDELEGQRQRAESLLRAKRDLVANVSHELRTPLASIRGHTESLLMEDLEDGAERRHRYLDVIHRETERLNRLIGDLFDLSTAEVGALPLTLQPVSLGDVVAEVAESFRPIARRERQITLVSTIEPDLPSAWADRARVVQILSNLLRNALRHTPEGGLVSIRVERDADFVRTTVEDTGVGIAPEHLARVFERFYRGDNARDRASGGVGLGLAIVRELVEAMDGTVHAASTIGEGSRFSFALPLASEPASPTPGRQVTTAS